MKNFAHDPQTKKSTIISKAVGPECNPNLRYALKLISSKRDFCSVW